MRKKKNKAAKPQASRGEAAGASFRPTDVPEPEAQGTASQGGAVPLGLPISAAEYEKLQKRARRVALPPTSSGQQDPSG
jgi:hypothetical protein